MCPPYVTKVRTVKVSNISLATSEKDIKEFFSFSGDIQYVEMQRYCIEDDQRLLVYEFMTRGSLENHLFRSYLL
ncbi:hypothetical protein ACSBR2_036716 [Camellia fascicularis]